MKFYELLGRLCDIALGIQNNGTVDLAALARHAAEMSRRAAPTDDIPPAVISVAQQESPESAPPVVMKIGDVDENIYFMVGYDMPHRTSDGKWRATADFIANNEDLPPATCDYICAERSVLIDWLDKHTQSDDDNDLVSGPDDAGEPANVESDDEPSDTQLADWGLSITERKLYRILKKAPDLPMAEVAALLGIAIGTANSYRTSIRKKLALVKTVK